MKKIPLKNNEVILVLKIDKKFCTSDKLYNILKFEIKRLQNHYSNLIILDLNDTTKKKRFGVPIINRLIEFETWKNLQKNNTFFCIIDPINPFLDLELLEKMIKISKYDNDVYPIGAIPGTAPEILINTDHVMQFLSGTYDNVNSIPVYSDSQRKYNNQFDISRPIRVKIFSVLIKKIKNLEKLTVNQFVKELEKDSIFNLILDYGENVKTKNVGRCLHCNSKNFIPLYCNTSQPILGFLPSSKSFYQECLNCGLVLLKKQCKIEDLHKFYDEYERPLENQNEIIANLVKKRSGTHFEEKLRVQRIFQEYLKKKSKVVDVGCGFGEFACLIKKFNPRWDVTGIDFSLKHVKRILQKFSVKTEDKNFVKEIIGDKINMISAMHVVEHIPFPNLIDFFNNVHNSLDTNGYFLLTTPNYNSSIARIFDYHLAMPPIHQTIFSDRWLIDYLKEKKLFKLIKKESASVILENFESWFSYYSKNAPSEDVRNMAEIWKSIHNNKKLFVNLKDKINDQNQGSEIILLFQKTRRNL